MLSCRNATRFNFLSSSLICANALASNMSPSLCIRYLICLIQSTMVYWDLKSSLVLFPFSIQMRQLMIRLNVCGFKLLWFYPTIILGWSCGACSFMNKNDINFESNNLICFLDFPFGGGKLNPHTFMFQFPFNCMISSSRVLLKGKR